MRRGREQLVWLKGLVSGVESSLSISLPGVTQLNDFDDFTEHSKRPVPCASGEVLQMIRDLTGWVRGGPSLGLPEGMQSVDLPSTVQLVCSAARFIAETDGSTAESLEMAAEYLLVNMFTALHPQYRAANISYADVCVHRRLENARTALLATPEDDSAELATRSTALLVAIGAHKEHCGHDKHHFVPKSFDQLALLQAHDRKEMTPVQRLVWFQLVELHKKDGGLTRTVGEFDTIVRQAEEQLQRVSDGATMLLEACGFKGTVTMDLQQLLPDLSGATEVTVKVGRDDNALILMAHDKGAHLMPDVEVLGIEFSGDGVSIVGNGDRLERMRRSAEELMRHGFRPTRATADALGLDVPN